MNCPHCNSDQTNVDFIRHDWAYIECANCDYEGEASVIHTEPDISPELAWSIRANKEAAIKRRRRAYAR